MEFDMKLDDHKSIKIIFPLPTERPIEKFSDWDLEDFELLGTERAFRVIYDYDKFEEDDPYAEFKDHFTVEVTGTEDGFFVCQFQDKILYVDKHHECMRSRCKADDEMLGTISLVAHGRQASHLATSKLNKIRNTHREHKGLYVELSSSEYPLNSAYIRITDRNITQGIFMDQVINIDKNSYITGFICIQCRMEGKEFY